MKTYLRACLISIFVLMAAAAFAEPIMLEYKFTAGEVDKYKMTMDMSLDMPPMRGESTAPPVGVMMIMTTTQRTLQVFPDGTAKVRLTYGVPTIVGAKTSTNTAKKLAGQSMIMKMSKRGQTLSMEGFDKVMAASGVKNMDFSKLMCSASSNALLPKGPVEVGQSWTQNAPMPFGNSQMNVTSTLIDADEQVWDQKAVRIKQDISGQLDLKEMMRAMMAGAKAGGKSAPDFSSVTGALDLSGDMIHIFAPAMGKLLRSDGNVQAKMTMNMPSDSKQAAPRAMSFTMNMRITIARLK